MSKIYFLLGSTPQLSEQELQAVFPNHSFRSITSHLVELETEASFDWSMVMNHLGGTVKILAFKELLSSNKADDLEAAIAEILRTSTSKIQFAIAEYDRDHLPKLSPGNVKNALSELGLNVRYREGSRSGVSAAVLIHNVNMVELNVINTPEGSLIAQTVATQNIDEWSTRDREKPYANRKKGMLPPKVARIMVNTALGLKYGPDFFSALFSQTPLTPKPIIYDPFCGTGTILMEGLLSGAEVVGSDLDEEAVSGALKNLTWLSNHYQLNKDFKVIMGDVSNIHPQVLGKKVDALITEPFLGKPLPQPSQVANIFKGLEKMYLGAFKNWRHILNNEAVLVVIFPLVEVEGRRYSFEAFLDKIKPLGYTIESEPILYRRPQAIVQRHIHIFRFNTSK